MERLYGISQCCLQAFRSEHQTERTSFDVGTAPRRGAELGQSLREGGQRRLELRADGAQIAQRFFDLSSPASVGQIGSDEGADVLGQAATLVEDAFADHG